MTLPEAGKVIEAMHGSPGLLAVIVLQLATLANGVIHLMTADLAEPPAGHVRDYYAP